jgi:hypothetical protein
VFTRAGAPGNATPASTYPSSVVVTVNLGPTTLVSASITAATTTTTFTELLNISISGLSEEQRTRLATRPIKVAAYTGLQHLSTQRADVLLSALVSESLALGYRHILFSYAPSGPAAARPILGQCI